MLHSVNRSQLPSRCEGSSLYFRFLSFPCSSPRISARYSTLQKAAAAIPRGFGVSIDRVRPFVIHVSMGYCVLKRYP